MSLPGLASSMKFRWGLQVFGDSFTGMFSPFFFICFCFQRCFIHIFLISFYRANVGKRSRKRSNWIRRHGESTDEGEPEPKMWLAPSIDPDGTHVKRSQTERERRTLRREQLVWIKSLKREEQHCVGRQRRNMTSEVKCDEFRPIREAQLLLITSLILKSARRRLPTSLA